ncbi:unannotated protein [freshwater metagenome]|uniref:Unannotated protein n=1 Tax=freshwater metagenome TaxID=449393 RepID=A0A6J6GEK8_9ZZZZ
MAIACDSYADPAGASPDSALMDLSRFTVSRASAPAPRTSERRADVTRTTAASTTRATIAIKIVAKGVIKVCSSQLEEQAVPPWEDKVETRATEERSDDD